ncbi:MAG: leucine--tRNA ligase [Nanoarchaeota archaeon]|nr:leucine--tRNA ligase [Nanoarchaeota archaeon]
MPKKSTFSDSEPNIFSFNEIEKKWQRRWEEAKVFEAVPDKRNKFFINFPYPYINGHLHLGHAFSVTRVDVAARYKRMNGFNVLFPQGWHCTGTPVWAAAQRIREKEEKQIQIMKTMGFSEKEILKFGEVKHWMDTFVPAAQEDLSRIGASVDWRRSFVTTDLNPYYDKFIRWQFNKLREKGLVVKGKRPVVWCVKDKMVVGDHDRAEGEGETPQEYYLLKFKFGDSYLIAATLRPETVFGQTNFWVNPDANYVKARIGNETWIVSKECLDKLELQEKDTKMMEYISGKDLIGKHCEAPLIGRKIMILPARFVDPTMGTGLVTSVPSDAPYDYIALRNMQEMKETEKNKLGFSIEQIEEIEDIEIIPIIKTEKYGDKAAVKVVEESGVVNQEDPKLDSLTQEVYKEGYHNGILLNNCGEYSGMKVKEAKEKMKEDMIKKGLLEIFYELSGKVVCRCLTPSVVKIVSDQWFLKYGDKEWKEKVRKELEGMKLYPDLVRQQFNYVIGWLNDWACTHHHGAGTKLPWDEHWVIESLSDSTIYMAYYTIAHLIKEYPLDKIDDSFFDYVLLGEGKGSKEMDKMRKEFEYWYPFDVRSSGKDLVQNHLSFCMFNHAAIFPEKHWPKSFSVNGWLLVEGDKMSKSKGNFFTIRQVLEKHSADSVRAGLMMGGEGLDDPNFGFANVEIVTQKIHGFFEFARLNYKKAKKAELSRSDRLFVSSINRYLKEGSEAMENMMFRTAFDKLFFQMQRVLKEYINRGGSNQGVLNDFIEIQIKIIAPFCPHVAEELWNKIGKKEFISLAEWPQVEENKIDTKLEESEKGVDKTVADVLNVLSIVKEKTRKEGEKVYVYVMPFELEHYNAELLSRRVQKEVKIFAVNDKNKYDPEGKAGKAKPGKPGIYVE